MSHFVRCDRCATEEHVMGTISLPPGWQKICNADLCEPCCMLVRDFIRFTPADAARLPVEPIEDVTPLAPVGDKLFETAPEEICATPADFTVAPTTDSQNAGATGAQTPPAGIPTTTSSTTSTEMKTTPSNLDECSTEERVRTRAAKRRKKLLGPDTPPDKRTAFPHGENEVQS
jgi:hypothetical protein